MSNTQQDSGIVGVVAAVGLLVLIGGGVLLYQYRRTTEMKMVVAEQRKVQLFAETERARAEAQRAQAESSAKLAQANVQLAIPIQPIAQPSPEDESSIRAKLMAQQADWNNGDLDAFMKVYWKDDRLTFASGGKLTRGWQATLDGYKSKYSTKEEIGKLTFGELEFQQLDQTVMLVLGTWHLERSEKSVGGNFSLVWKKFQDQWLIVHDHTSAVPTVTN